MSSLIKASSSQLDYVKLCRRLIALICLKDIKSSKREKIVTLDFKEVFFLNDLKNMIKDFLF